MSKHRAFTVKSIDRKTGLVRIFKTLVSHQDAHLLRSYYWVVNLDRNGNTYLQRSTTKGLEHLHKRICGATDAEFVEHKNGDTLDNRRENLIKHPMSEKGVYAVGAVVSARPEVA